MHRVIHFELGVRDPERTSGFYRDVFGWKVTRWDGGGQPYYLLTTGPADSPGIDGGMMVHQDAQPRTVNTIAVPSVEEFAKKVVAAGGEVVVPRMAIPGVGWQAYCKDPDGVLFGIHESDEGAM